MLNTLKTWISTDSLPNPRKITDLSMLTETLLVAKDIASWSPDAFKLERKEYQPVFVCCQLGRGGTEHSWIEGNYKLTDGKGRSANMSLFTKDRYELWQAKRGPDTYPIPLVSKAPAATWLDAECRINNQRMRTARLKGKLYQIRSDIMFQLDNLRHNGVVFNRQLIDCLVPFRYLGGHQLGEARLSPEYVEQIKAWFYFAEPDYWQPLIDVGAYFTPARLVKPRNPEFRKWAVEPYYYFNPREYANTE